MNEVIRTTVTQRIAQIKQPYGGYLPVKDFKVTSFEDNFDLIDLKNENISASLIGTTVDYLTRYYAKGQFGERVSVMASFDIAWAGARNLGEEVMSKASMLMSEIKDSENFSDEVIKNACYLSSLDVAYRRGSQFYDPTINCVPDSETTNKIKIMVKRSLNFFELSGGMVHSGFVLSTAGSKYINNGDGDFITPNALWDMKVSINKPTSRHTLQIFIYYLMGLRTLLLENELMYDLESISEIGIFNPRLNKAYTLDIEKIDPETIKLVSKEVIGY